jgi:hypothetical protein
MGYDSITDIIEAGVLLKFITKGGAFYTVGTQKLQGKEKLAQYLEADEKILHELTKKIEGAIKDMRTGKKVLDDEVFDSLEEIAEEVTGVEGGE